MTALHEHAQQEVQRLGQVISFFDILSENITLLYPRIVIGSIEEALNSAHAMIFHSSPQALKEKLEARFISPEISPTSVPPGPLSEVVLAIQPIVELKLISKYCRLLEEIPLSLKQPLHRTFLYYTIPSPSQQITLTVQDSFTHVFGYEPDHLFTFYVIKLAREYKQVDQFRSLCQKEHPLLWECRDSLFGDSPTFVPPPDPPSDHARYKRLLERRAFNTLIFDLLGPPSLQV